MLHLDKFNLNGTRIETFWYIFLLVLFNLFDELYSPLFVNVSIDFRDEVTIRSVYHVLQGLRG